MLISHFTTDVTFINSEDVTEEDLQGVTHLFYYGLVSSKLPKSFQTLLDSYEETFVAIGYNSEQLGNHFTFMSTKHEKKIDQLTITKDPKQTLQDLSREIIEIIIDKDVDILIEGENNKESSSYPVMIQKNNHYYYGVDTIWSDEVVLFGETLHEIFGVTHKDKHQAYIRLEDVHPLVDPKNVAEIAEVLKEKQIPYMVAVIPVYTDPETKKEYHFSDSPELLKLLKKMQNDGASIVLHGYTHQFRESETGEGFEFWDVENNTPIYAPADESFTLKKESEFKTKNDYKEYLAELENYEKQYTEEKLTKGIQELANYGLYPLAFEAPHYTMSQNGYQIASEYFSTYVGQVQLSDENWEVMDSTPYVTSPSFLNGMELLPETIGYVVPDKPESVNDMMDSAERMSQSNDTIISGFYHPYLGVDGFKELIHEMEKLPNLQWIDLKARDVSVQTDEVSIVTENGEIKADVNRGKLAFSSIGFLSYHFFEWSTLLSWALSIIGIIAVFIFIAFTFLNQSKRRTAK